MNQITSCAWVIDCGNSQDGGFSDCLRWNDVLEKLNRVITQSGSLSLDCSGETIKHLQVRSENGASIITLGAETEGDYEVRTVSNNTRQVDMESVTILGDVWDQKMICYDSKIVVSVFKEFYETCEVSSNLLS